VRQRFDFLFEELSVRLGRLAPRYALWLRLRELGLDPERLTRDGALRFCRYHLDDFLREHELLLAPRAARSLTRAVARHDPDVRTPAQWAAGG
jgi:hypothetical protein